MPDEATDPALATGPPEPDPATQISRIGPIQEFGNDIAGLLTGLPEWLQATLLVAIGASVALLIQTAADMALRRITRDKGRLQTRKLITSVTTPARIFAIVMGLAIGTAVASNRGLLADWIERIWPQTATVAFILSVTLVLLGLVNGIDRMLLARYTLDARDNFRARRMHTQVAVISRTIRIFIAIIGIGVALTTFEEIEQFGATFLASAGIAGIAVGFAAKPVLENVIAGVQIALTQPIRLEDVVIMEGEFGHVEEITTTYVVIRIWDKRRIIVPFSKIIDSPFQNWTRRSSDLTGKVMLYLDYTTQVADIREKLNDITTGHPLWDGRVRGVTVTDANERTMEVRILVSAGDASALWDLRCNVRERILDWLRDEHPDWLPRLREVRLHQDIAAPGSPGAVSPAGSPAS
ncbi:MAG: mechanosensitive ion channel family protein [Planctomycetota bacterium]